VNVYIVQIATVKNQLSVVSNGTARATSSRREKDVTALNSVVSEMITLLQPDTEYIVDIVAINSFGRSPVLSSIVKTWPLSAGENYQSLS